VVDDEVVEDVEYNAPPLVPASMGENANADPDDVSFKSEQPATPDDLPAEAYGAEEIQVTDVRFDGKILQLLHKHPFLMTIGVIVLGGVLVGATAMSIRGAKCALSRGL